MNKIKNALVNDQEKVYEIKSHIFELWFYSPIVKFFNKSYNFWQNT